MHTKLPFYVGCQNDAVYIISGKSPAKNNDYPVHDADRTVIARIYNPDDAQYIVRAANCHQQLVSALEDAIAELTLYANDSGEDYNNSHLNEILAKAKS